MESYRDLLVLNELNECRFLIVYQKILQYESSYGITLKAKGFHVAQAFLEENWQTSNMFFNIGSCFRHTW